MTKNIESRRVKEALQLQVSAVKAFAERLPLRDSDELAAEFVELERAVADLRDVVESLPHQHRATLPDTGGGSERGRDGFEARVSTVKETAAHLSIQNIEGLDSDLLRLEQAAGDLRASLESTHGPLTVPERAGGPAASPATTRPEREAKGAETAAGTQRHERK